MGTEPAGADALVMRPLDFVVIGAAKSGTTTLFHLLRQHPEIVMPADKERPFFSKDDVYLAGWSAYVKDVFEGAPVSKTWGKVTPRYLGDLHVPARMAQLMPHVRLHALLRHPVDRAFSKYRMAARQGIEKRTFDEVVDAQLSDEALESARSVTVPIKDAVVVRGEYGRLIGTFLAEFPRDQLLVHFTDELTDSPRTVVSEILSHIGLDPSWCAPVTDERHYVGGDRQRFGWLPAAARSITPVHRLWRRVPADPRRRLQHWYSTRLSVSSRAPVPELSDEARRRLVEFYRPDVEVLEARIGRRVPWADLHPSEVS